MENLIQMTCQYFDFFDQGFHICHFESFKPIMSAMMFWMQMGKTMGLMVMYIDGDFGDFKLVGAN